MTAAATPPPVIEPSPVARGALALMAVVVAGAALYWLRDILTPLAMAMFLLIMIDGLARWLARQLQLPGHAAIPTALLVIVLGFAASVWVVASGLAGVIGSASAISARLDAIISDVAALAHIEVAPTARELVTRLDLPAYAARAALSAQNVLTGAFFTLVYLGFLIAARGSFQKKVEALFPHREERREALNVFERVRGGVEGYLWVQTVTGVMIAGAAWLVMVFIGLENALFWAFVIFLVGYIPVIGGAIAGLAPPLFALVQFQTYWQAIVLLAALQTILFVVGNFIQPRMQGQNQNIDPIVVLLSLALWSALWGVIGAFLSTPLAVMVMAITAEFRGSRWIAVLLSGDGEPYPDPPPGAKTPPRRKGRRRR